MTRHVRYQGPRGGLKTLSEFDELDDDQKEKHTQIQWYDRSKKGKSGIRWKPKKRSKRKH